MNQICPPEESRNLSEPNLKKIDDRLISLEGNQKFSSLYERVVSEKKSQHSKIDDDDARAEILRNSKRIDYILRVVENINENLQNDVKIKHLELFQKSQYSCNEFVLQKVSRNSQRIDEIFHMLETIKDQFGDDDTLSNLSGIVNPALGRDVENANTGIHGNKLI